MKHLKTEHFVVQPALWFGNIPNTIPESMSAGKAIIAVNFGSLPELVYHNVNGLIVQPGAVNFLSWAISCHSNNSIIGQIGKKSREFYEKEHTLELHLSRLLMLFNRLV